MSQPVYIHFGSGSTSFRKIRGFSLLGKELPSPRPHAVELEVELMYIGIVSVIKSGQYEMKERDRKKSNFIEIKNEKTTYIYPSTLSQSAIHVC